MKRTSNPILLSLLISICSLFITLLVMVPFSEPRQSYIEPLFFAFVIGIGSISPVYFIYSLILLLLCRRIKRSIFVAINLVVSILSLVFFIYYEVYFKTKGMSFYSLYLFTTSFFLLFLSKKD